jgi:predicted DNA-binding transcriptional regulator AlpA
MTPIDLVDVPEIAKMLKVSRRTAWRYVTEGPDFPAPEAQLPNKRLWKRSAVERWADKTLPLPKGPPPGTSSGTSKSRT